ncbi:MAG: hypothetical protein QM522_07200 [Chitinophagaceae bacterium]|nr:hypothetical protein [Chitinophagaceae bacterium]
MQAAAGGQEGRPVFDLLLQLVARAAEQGEVAQVEADVPVGLADEIEHRGLLVEASR